RRAYEEASKAPYHERIEKTGTMFEAWLSTGGEWSQSSFYMNLKQTQRLTRRGCRRWLLRKEMEDKWGPDIAGAMITRKELDPDLSMTETRVHPECEGVLVNGEKVMQYKVWDDDAEIN
ncbi:unnamed protein product, partial [Effrenium voratum]